MNKVVIITGATGGIGKEVAYRFSRENERVVICYHKNPDLADEVASHCQNLGAKEVLTIPLDLEDEDSIQNLVAEVVRRWQEIHILVNVAGYLDVNFLADQDEKQIDRIINVNLCGLIKITKAALPHLKESIINVGSALGLAGRKRLAVYSATKFAVQGFTQSLAHELPNLRVYAVNPSLTATRMGNFQGTPPAKVAEIIWKAAEGKYRAPSGSAINVKDYLCGERFRKILILARFVKKLINS